MTALIFPPFRKFSMPTMTGWKKTIREVNGHLHEMVAEIFILLAVQHLKHSRGGIAAAVARHLVYLIEKHQRI